MSKSISPVCILGSPWGQRCHVIAWEMLDLVMLSPRNMGRFKQLEIDAPEVVVASSTLGAKGARIHG